MIQWLCEIMPIDFDDWNNGTDEVSTESKIEKFLTINQGKAFTLGEIVDVLFPMQSDSLTDTLQRTGDQIIVKSALNALMRNKIVKAKFVRSNDDNPVYYTIV